MVNSVPQIFDFFLGGGEQDFFGGITGTDRTPNLCCRTPPPHLREDGWVVVGQAGEEAPVALPQGPPALRDVLTPGARSGPKTGVGGSKRSLFAKKGAEGERRNPSKPA